MHNFIKHFKRERAGRWRCIEAAELSTPAGRIKVAPGTVFVSGRRFMNFDIAAALEEQFRNAAYNATRDGGS